MRPALLCGYHPLGCLTRSRIILVPLVIIEECVIVQLVSRLAVFRQPAQDFTHKQQELLLFFALQFCLAAERHLTWGQKQTITSSMPFS